MAAPVRIEAKAWNDIRFVTLARLLGLADADHAIIKVARIWSWQTEHFTTERPTYSVDLDTIESVLGPGGGAALVRAKLAVETPDGYRMCGTEGQIEWCEELTSKRQRAGQVRAARGRRDERGRLTGSDNCNTDNASPAHAGCAGPASTSTPPAQSSAPAPAPDPAPDPIPGRESRAPAAAAAPVKQSGVSAWSRRKAWWDEMLAADQRVRAAGIEPNAPTLPPSFAGENEKRLAACERQLSEAGYDAAAVDAKMRHIVAIAEREAIREGHRNWFKPALIWDPARASRSADTSLEEASRKRDGPAVRQSGTRPPERPNPMRPIT